MAPAQATSWPQRSVRLVLPVGGSADVAAQALVKPLSAAFSTSFIIENRPGAAATIGTDAVAKSASEGQPCC